VLCLKVCIKGGLDEQMMRKILTCSQEQDIKDKLKATTQEALDLGVSHARIIFMMHSRVHTIFVTV